MIVVNQGLVFLRGHSLEKLDPVPVFGKPAASDSMVCLQSVVITGVEQHGNVADLSCERSTGEGVRGGVWGYVCVTRGNPAAPQKCTPKTQNLVVKYWDVMKWLNLRCRRMIMF